MQLAASVTVGSEPPNASAATRFNECPLNPPFVKSENLLLFRLLSVFAGVDVLGAVIAIFRRNGGTEPVLPDAVNPTNGGFSSKGVINAKFVVPPDHDT